MPEFKPGDVFVNHRIDGLAGRGGMGVVYRARDLDLDRVVAIKVIAPALAEEPDFRARFVAESKAAASIEHPHVIPVYYAGEREGVLFIVMRYVDGPDLRALVRAEGRLDPERAAHVVSQVGGALDAAHAHGLVHRDVKPANVLLGAEDHAYLTDFGLTKHEASTGGLSRAGGWVGTLGFVAPEQIRGERVDARTDVYALGCVLVHALTGSAPYIRDSDEATLWAHLNAAPPTDTVPPEFTDVVQRALAKDPAERFPSAGDLGRAALAAAGRSAAPGPERNVARGAAAPEGTPQTAATARASVPAHEGETHVSPPADGAGGGADGGGPDGDGGGRGRTRVASRGGGGGADRGGGRGGALGALARPRVLAGAGAVLIAGALAALLLGGGDDTPTAARTTPTQPPRDTPSVASDPLPIATRPNSITIAGGKVWALSTKSGEIVVLDARDSHQIDRIGIGEGGTSVAAGFKSVWAVKGNSGALIRRSARTRRTIPGSDATISVPGQPISIATGEGAVWVGVRKKGVRDGSAEAVVRVDPSTPEQRAIPIPGGVQDVAVGAGAVWVTTTFRNSVIRIDARDTSRIKEIAVGRMPNGIAVGYGAVWVAAADSDQLVRISPRGFVTDRIPLKFSPTRVTAGGGSIWVTAREANRLIRVDPKRRAVREQIDTGGRPFALDVARDAVWVTLLNEGVQRIRYVR